MLLTAMAMPAGGPARSLAGRYSASFPDSTVDGETYTGENIVEVVPVGPRAAYVRVHLDFYNGHQCGIAGVARAEGNRLVYHDRTPAYGEGPPCTLSIEHRGAALRLDDEGGSCKGYCGMRGTLSGVDVPWSSRRTITYLPRLRASWQYRDALTEWRTGTSVR